MQDGSLLLVISLYSWVHYFYLAILLEGSFMQLVNLTTFILNSTNFYLASPTQPHIIRSYQPYSTSFYIKTDRSLNWASSLLLIYIHLQASTAVYTSHLHSFYNCQACLAQISIHFKVNITGSTLFYTQANAYWSIIYYIQLILHLKQVIIFLLHTVTSYFFTFHT